MYPNWLLQYSDHIDWVLPMPMPKIDHINFRTIYEPIMRRQTYPLMSCQLTILRLRIIAKNNREPILFPFSENIIIIPTQTN